jgi:hypothetical protein
MAILRTFSKALGLHFGSTRPFPELSDVFADDLSLVSDVLFPICSIDLSFVDRKFSGLVYLLQFNEDPYNENVRVHFNEYCGFNKIGFRIENGKYKFLTDYKYFDVSPKWLEWLSKTKADYLQAKWEYRESGKKFGIGFIIPGGSPRWLQEDDTPKEPDGTPMTFIAQFDTGRICKDYCEKRIYLFYSEKYKLAVQVYQVT